MAIARRAFLKQAVYAALIGGSHAITHAQAPAKRRQVTVGGRRVKTIDLHAHCQFPEVNALVPGTVPNHPHLFLGPDRLEAMDLQGIDVQALSINAFWYGTDRDAARKLIDLQNHKLAEACAATPDRFVPLASVALQHPDLAVEQLETAIHDLGMRGVAVNAHVNGDELSAAKFRPFWAAAEALGVVVFIHPLGAPELQRLRGNGALTNVIGFPLDTTIALSHLVFDGTLDAFPHLKLCIAHGGGYLDVFRRLDHGCDAAGNANCTSRPKRAPSEYVKQLYVDSLVFTPEALRHLVAEVGASHIVIGTDYPYPWTMTAVDHILSTPGLTNADRRAMLGGTAAALLGITPGL